MGETWWWLLAAGVAVAAVVVWRLVSRRRPPPRKRPPPGAAGPAAGDIWWADVPFEDGTGSKVRPCLVLRGTARSLEVLKITSQDQSRRNDHVEIPTRQWDRGAKRNSFLDLTDPIRVPRAAFANKAGRLDAATWRKVRRLHGV